MNVEEANSIIDGYANWWRDQVKVAQSGNAVRLVCPMLDRHNDHMSLYIIEDDDHPDELFLTDLGSTLEDLSFSGCDVLQNKTRSRKLEQTITGFGVQRNGEELLARATKDNLFPKMNMLMQAMASVDDLFFTTRDNVRSLFFEDIADWLYKNNVRYTTNVKFAGLSGFESKFDFVIPQTPGKAPERLIKAVGNPTENSIRNALFGWTDISKFRENSTSFILLNASADNAKPINNSLTQACTAYDVTPLIWHGPKEPIPASLAA